MTSTTSTAVGDPEAAAILTEARQRCEPLLVAAVATLADPLRHMAGYHFGWWDAEGRPTRAQSGKALRPALVLCAAAGGGAQTSAAYAAAVELIHNFSLLQSDSVIDPVDLARAVSLVESAGGRWCAQQHAEQRRLAAVSTLPECAAGGGLPILAHLATHRDR